MKEFKYKHHQLFNPVLQALHKLGGSASVSEIEDVVIELLELTENEIADIHRGTTTKLNYRLRWARNYLKHYGVIVNSERGVWALTSKGNNLTQVDPKIVTRRVNQLNKKQKGDVDEGTESTITASHELDDDLNWKEELLAVIKGMPYDAFERLCQRFLRELGFINVEVTGKPNDGGIDGRGMLKLGGILSFHVVFQAKRYKDTVSPSVIRDFRGSMSANVDKGLVITTGRFTREATKEAQRDGALPIDLIDGDYLADKLKELKLGLSIEMVEKVKVRPEWFKGL